MNGRTKLAAGAVMLAVGVSVPTLLMQKPDSPQPVQRARLAPVVQLVPHVQNQTCPPTLSHDACKTLIPDAKGRR